MDKNTSIFFFLVITTIYFSVFTSCTSKSNDNNITARNQISYSLIKKQINLYSINDWKHKQGSLPNISYYISIKNNTFDTIIIPRKSISYINKDLNKNILLFTYKESFIKTDSLILLPKSQKKIKIIPSSWTFFIKSIEALKNEETLHNNSQIIIKYIYKQQLDSIKINTNNFKKKEYTVNNSNLTYEQLCKLQKFPYQPITY